MMIFFVDISIFVFRDLIYQVEESHTEYNRFDNLHNEPVA